MENYLGDKIINLYTFEEPYVDKFRKSRNHSLMIVRPIKRSLSVGIRPNFEKILKKYLFIHDGPNQT